jgi:prolyl oligopeptidase
MTSIRRLPGLLSLFLSVLACSPIRDTVAPVPQPAAPAAAAGPRLPAAPEVARSGHVDHYFGVAVADPYRWLEDLDSDATRRFVEEQNARARPFLEALPARPRLRSRMVELWSYERVGIPEEHGGRYFYLYNDGRQDQDVLRVADARDAAPRVLIDPATFDDTATTSLADFDASPDGAFVAYGVSDGGTDWKTWRVRRVDGGADLDEALGQIKFSSAAWSRDSAGFYYSRYPLGAAGQADDAQQVSVYYHRLGSPQSEDRHVFSLDDEPSRDPYAELSDDGRYLILNVYEGFDANAVYYRDLAAADAPVVRLLDDWDALYAFIGHHGRELFFKTSRQAPNGRVVAIDLDRPQPGHWREVVPESADALDGADLVGGRIFAGYLVDARSRVLVYDLDGHQVGEVELPGIGAATGFDGEDDATETFFAFESYTTPQAVYRVDLSTLETTVFQEPEIDFDFDAYETEQVFYASEDGTRVPMFLVHRRGLERDGANPTMLYGYGGFSVSLTPEFLVPYAVWLEIGGLLAFPNLRGGGEYGEAWHQAGTRARKQNVFDDFIAAAEWLLAEGYTSTPKLAVHGHSNGGLLIGAVMTQRPDLYGVALPAVGVLDMLRYHTASANAWQWGSDFGRSDDEDDFRALLAYSPVHNVRAGSCFPPTLVTTADHDDRVVPWHSYKFAAALQHGQSCDRPILLRIETRAGHGAGKPVWMQIEDYADQWAFAAWHLGMDVPGR